MTHELIIAIPGPWKDSREFLTRVVNVTHGEFMYAAGILANPKERDHVSVDLHDADPQIKQAFEYAGQGKLSADTLSAIANHRLLAYLRFPLVVPDRQSRIHRFTHVLEQAGGFAVKIESAGIAHEWIVWEEILNSQDPFDLYRGFVVLIADEGHYYSCGMHHFELPDTQVPRSLGPTEAADLLNQFNHFQIVEDPSMETGHTFSVSEDVPQHLLTRIKDTRHHAESPFHNPHGLWDLGAP